MGFAWETGIFVHCVFGMYMWHADRFVIDRSIIDRSPKANVRTYVQAVIDRFKMFDRMAARLRMQGQIVHA